MPIRVTPRVRSGSAADFLLEAERADALVLAAKALIERHLAPRMAKRTIDRLARGQRVALRLPVVEDPDTVVRDLARHGVKAELRRSPETIDVAALRARLGLSQAEFALRFGLDVGTVRGWEQGRFRPDRPARVLLRVIARDPNAVDDALGVPDDHAARAPSARIE